MLGRANLVAIETTQFNSSQSRSDPNRPPLEQHMTFATAILVLAAASADDFEDLRGLTERVHEGTRRCVSSTDGFSTFSTHPTKFLFKIYTTNVEDDVVNFSALATLGVVVTATPDYLREGNQGVHRFDGKFKDGKLEMTSIIESPDKDGGITKRTISIYGILEGGFCQGYITTKWEKPDGSTVTYGSVFSIEP